MIRLSNGKNMGTHLPAWNGSISQKIRGRILYFHHPDGSSVTLILSRGQYWTISKEIQEEAFFLRRPEEGRFIELECTTAGYRWHKIKSQRSTTESWKKEAAIPGTNRRKSQDR
jgi:hypothetical protein